MARARRTSSVLPPTPLLITESKEEFDRIRDALDDEIKPRGIIEELFVAEVADLVWQILRLRRCKAGVINLAFHPASAQILGRLMGAGPDVARDWISDPNVRKQVLGSLGEYQLDGSVIVAEAIRKSSHDLEPIESMLVSLEARRDKAFARIVQYRGAFGAQLRESSNRLIDGKVLKLEVDTSSQKSAA